MQFLKKNKIAIFILLALPVSFYSIDMAFADWLTDLRLKGSAFYWFLVSLRSPVDFISDGVTQAAISLAILFIGKFYSRRLYDVGRSLVISFAASGILVQVLKLLIGRARPDPAMTGALDFIGPHLRGGYDSFPSGHTTVAFCLAYALSRHFPRYRIIAYIPAAVIGFIRFEKKAHFFSDVLAGAVVGIIFGRLLFTYVIPYFRKTDMAGSSKAPDS
jgi:undecaprenyl-diphosphatase